MKIVDPKVAIAMLNRSHDQIPPVMPDDSDLRPKSPTAFSGNHFQSAPPVQQPPHYISPSLLPSSFTPHMPPGPFSIEQPQQCNQAPLGGK